MFNSKFGIEVEFTGITREQAAQAAVQILGGSVRHQGGSYDSWVITAPDSRKWQFMYDASITPQQKVGRRIISGSSQHRVEMVSPVLTYREDIGTVQSLIRKLRGAGGLVPENAGIHVHLDGAPHTPRSICNFIKIIASKNDLLYKALQIKPERMVYCKKLDDWLVKKIASTRPCSFEQIANIWYSGNESGRDLHYHNSRYAILNLHSFFTRNRTVELRGFNSALHAGQVRSYIVLALALNHQALTQKTASSRTVQAENPKFAMRTFLNRIGFIGDEFKSCRDHLCKNLDGNAAWRFNQGPKKNRHGGENQ